ncbi:MAG TPA: mannose-1-phosphate guanylyltransferase, partial [Gammaproteobacteria bacterium]|nr:mannose-1-phosphate guanylyltransferase [Gammaproteobacteria bacterium]
MIIPVILAGGSGSRLWPLSREAFPKQFIPLFDSESLLQKTLTRFIALPDVTSPIIICSEAHRFLVQDILVKQHSSVLATILEPTPKSTAPAIALAAFQALETYEDPLLLVLPADHLIEDKAGFQHTVLQAIQAARNGYLVTFGVTPTAAETGYGYIQCGEKISGAVSKVAGFIEKPPKAQAQQLMQSNQYLWNSGMFLFSARAFLQELNNCQPALSKKVELS